MKIDNLTKKRLILNMGFGSEAEPELTLALEAGESKEATINPEWDRIAINEG